METTDEKNGNADIYYGDPEASWMNAQLYADMARASPQAGSNVSDVEISSV